MQLVLGVAEGQNAASFWRALALNFGRWAISCVSISQILPCLRSLISQTGSVAFTRQA